MSDYAPSEETVKKWDHLAKAAQGAEHFDKHIYKSDCGGTFIYTDPPPGYARRHATCQKCGLKTIKSLHVCWPRLLVTVGETA